MKNLFNYFLGIKNLNLIFITVASMCCAFSFSHGAAGRQDIAIYNRTNDYTITVAAVMVWKSTSAKESEQAGEYKLKNIGPNSHKHHYWTETGKWIQYFFDASHKVDLLVTLTIIRNSDNETVLNEKSYYIPQDGKMDMEISRDLELDAMPKASRWGGLGNNTRYSDWHLEVHKKKGPEQGL